MTKGQGEADSLVIVVDDDASVRQALTSLLQSVGLRVEAFGSAAATDAPMEGTKKGQ
jgi:FixJ family two-component response regulator